ncbi:2-amino-3-carboxymuconate-6-semialdehyde decarboxylase [Cyphellophora attinorum]|uniref:2-amino-3-carboxymuconate-6-semialdehyde decarboxylase n=1 Tax=Cyphellophora attinorum TaxID=1664694 RepID=A0A0N1NXA3_9EURO|nr:2-amino-3-carboxymuconate-6-semialdehyde decarboxylase [Phialophora attinorum]KPI34540.1 2-amino-3-carboxymuconate-6-semialdehyde decarboxylase [Phialophora attinorum]
MGSNTADQAPRPSQSFSGPGRIDVHHHCFPGEIQELQSEFENNSYNLNYTPFPKSAEEHLVYMDEVGIQTAVIAPSIKQEWHSTFSPAEFASLCRRSLQSQMKYVSHNPLRFGCFAMLPLPHIHETIEFVRETQAMSPRPDGFAVTTAMGQRYLGDKDFEPVWKELDALGSVIFIHPADTIMPPGLNFGPFVQEFPFDTCRAITSIISSGTLLRTPNIHFIFSHNGGAFPYLADRIGKQHTDNIVVKANEGLSTRELLSTKKIYFDTSISSPMQYALIKNLGMSTDQLLYATDFPYTKRYDNTTYLDGYDAPKESGLFDNKDMEKIVRLNALKLLPRLAKLYSEFWP